MSVTFQSCSALVSSNSLSSISLSESEQLSAYALYKQATLGPLASQGNFTHLKTTFHHLNLVRRARYNSWRALGSMPMAAAKDRYVSLIWSRNRGRFAPLDEQDEAARRQLKEGKGRSCADLAALAAGLGEDARKDGGDRERRAGAGEGGAEGAADGKAADYKAVDYGGMDKEALVEALHGLQAEVDALRVFQVYKQGGLSRCRQTMTGEEWTDRYYEVKPGYLRCYKSERMRMMRAEIPLFIGVTCSVTSNEELLTNGGGTNNIKNPFVIQVKIPHANKSGINELVLGTSSIDEADDWCECILKASRDGGKRDTSGSDGDGAGKKKSFDMSLQEFVHKKYQASFLSSDNPDRQSYHGFFNLILIVAFVSNTRAIVDSVLKHGNVVASFILEVTTNPTSLSSTDIKIIIAFWSLWVFAVIAWAIEYVGGRTTRTTERVTRSLHFVNCVASLLIPWSVISFTHW